MSGPIDRIADATYAARVATRLGIRDATGAIASLNLLAGAWLFVSHWVLSYSASDPAWNDTVFGILVAAAALVRISRRPDTRWLSWLNAAVGVWLIVSGFTIASSSAATVNNVIVGTIVLALAIAAAVPARSRA